MHQCCACSKTQCGHICLVSGGNAISGSSLIPSSGGSSRKPQTAPHIRVWVIRGERRPCHGQHGDQLRHRVVKSRKSWNALMKEPPGRSSTVQDTIAVRHRRTWALIIRKLIISKNVFVCLPPRFHIYYWFRNCVWRTMNSLDIPVLYRQSGNGWRLDSLA